MNFLENIKQNIAVKERMENSGELEIKETLQEIESRHLKKICAENPAPADDAWVGIADTLSRDYN